MKILINGKEYSFVLTGTVGLIYLAERMLGKEFEAKDHYHLATLYLACLKACNRGTDMDTMDTDTLLSHMTSKLFGEMSTSFWDQWSRLEGIRPETADGEDKQGEN